MSVAEPIKLVINTPVGGSWWIIAKAIVPHLEQWTGEKIEIESRVGGNGVVAARHVFENKSVKTPSLYLGAVLQDFELDLQQDLVPLIDHGNLVKIMYVAADNPASDFNQLIGNNKTIDYGQIQVAPESDMMNEIAGQIKTRTSMQTVPFKSLADLSHAVLGHHITVGANATKGLLPLIESGKIKPIAVQGPYRSAYFPNVMTLEEQGFKTVSAMHHRTMIWASPGINPRLVADVRREWAKFVTSPAGQEMLKSTDHKIKPSEAADPEIVLRRLLKK